MKHLPLDIQTFKILRERNCLYVDKTEVIFRLTTSASRLHFLSRPRRFGKSLMISTLKSLFEGDKDLFEGLYIYDKWDWSKKHPVIRLDWSSGSHRSLEDIVDSISFQLETNAADYGLTLPPAQPARQFSELIRALYRKTGENVVLLIDEYDSPILDTMGQTTSELLQQVRILLHDFYKTVKASDDFLHFVFITGISKFSGLSLFSAMNNLRDITFNPDYASICGYTQNELDSNFADHIEAMLPNVNMTKEKLVSLIKKHYNGYSWDGETSVYNPYSTMYCFADKQFGAYWFSTGTPSFLMKMLQQSGDISIILEPIEVGLYAFESYDPENLDVVPLLFQTGYLTVKKKVLVEGRPQYTLASPNFEVHQAMLDHLFYAYTHHPTTFYQGRNGSLIDRMHKELRNLDASGLELCLKEMIAKVPYQHIIKAESWYHSIMLLWLSMLGFELIAEVPTNVGRIDAVWFCPEHTIVVEVKSHPKAHNIDALLDEAIAQIREKRYYEQFMGKQQVSIMGVAFAGTEIGCRIEEV